MTRFIKKFTAFMQNTIKFLLLADLIVGFGLACISVKGFNESVLIFGFIAVLSSFLGYKFINMNMSSNYKLLLILFIGFLLRVLWIININSIPTSDFKTIYDSAGSFLNGDRSMFHGVSYLGRFPHLTFITLYMALIRFLFPISNILVMKVINLLFSIIVLFLIYLIINILYSNKDLALMGTLIGALFPPFISFTDVFCSENIAMPFYLLSIFLFLVSIKYKNKLYLFVLSGAALAIGNLFRMVAVVALIAYFVYILIYYKDKLINKILKIGVMMVPYVIIMCFLSSFLQNLTITDQSLWKGREPNVTSILKGTNYNSFGAWNSEDAKLIEDNINDYDKLECISKDIIKDRLTTTPIQKLAVFFLGKFSMVWSDGDCGGVLWSQKDLSSEDVKFPVKMISTVSIPISTIFQIIYIIILLVILIGLFNKNKLRKIEELNLFYLILCGYGLTYLITEAQPRYSYIVSWVFIILAINGFEYLKIFRNSFVFYNDSL